MSQSRVSRGTARRIVRGVGFTEFYYHNTCIVRSEGSRVTLNSGGWRTATTRRAMNQASNEYHLGFGVYQKNHEWLVDFNGKTVPFYDGIVLDGRA